MELFSILSTMIGFIALIIAVVGCTISLNSSNRAMFSEIKSDVREIRSDMKAFEITMARQSAELNGRIDKQEAEFRGVMAKQDAEFKMFLRCGRLPARSTRLRDSLS